MDRVDQAWRVAQEEAHRAMGSGAVAVAVTGSLARGDWSEGSDVDLWVLTNEDGRRETTSGSLPVTWLCQRPATAASFASLCLFEVDQMKVLADPQGHLERIRAAHEEQREAIGKALFRQTVLYVLGRLSRVGAGPALERVRRLRDVASRMATLWLFLHHGRRVAKLRHFEQRLPGGAFVLLEQALGVPWTAAQWDQVRRLTPSRYRAARRLLGEVHAPSKWLALAGPHPSDAAVHLRRHFEENVVAPLERRGLQLPKALQRHRLLLQGATEGEWPAEVAACVEALFDALEVGRFLKPESAWRGLLRAAQTRAAGAG